MIRVAVGLALLVAATATRAAVPPQMTVELIASTLAPRPGSTVLVGFRMVPKPGWHGYWSNTGGSGIAPTVTWHAPPGVQFGPLLHPAPSLFKSLGVVSYVHSGEHVLVSRMRVPAGIPVGTTIPVQADLRFAVCSDRLCVPGQGSFSLHLVAGSGAPGADAGLLERALARVPTSVSGGSYSSEDGKLTLALPAGARLRGPAAHFFPDANGFFDAFAARGSDGSPVRIVTPMTGSPPARITGVATDGASSYRLSLVRWSPATETEAKRDAAAPRPGPPPVAAPRGAARALPPPPPGQKPSAAPQSRGSFAAVVAAVGTLFAVLLFLTIARRPRP